MFVVHPRPIFKQHTYMVTRRTTQRQFLLRPNKAINQCIRYCVSIATEKSGVELHALMFMSNHYHIILTDVEGRLPVFTETLNRLLAKSLNVYHGRGENFWAGHVQPSHVHLGDRTAVLDKLAYLLCNPVAADLVKEGKYWPGIRVFLPGETKCVRPKFYFRDEDSGGSMPKKTKLKLSLPECLGDKKQALKELRKLIKDNEQILAEKRKASGKQVLGKEAVKRQRIDATPSSKDKPSNISPRLVCRDKWRKIEILHLMKSFLNAYKQAWESYKAGEAGVQFPLGSYKMGLIKHAVIAEADC